MSFFSKLATIGRYYKNVCYLTVPSAIGFGTWQHIERSKLLSSYHDDHINEMLHQHELTPRHVLQKGLVVGLAWPLIYHWIDKELNTTNNLKVMSEENMNRVILKNHMISKMQDLPLDHVEKVSEYLLRHEGKEDDCPFEIPKQEQSFITGLESFIKKNVRHIV